MPASAAETQRLKVITKEPRTYTRLMHSLIQMQCTHAEKLIVRKGCYPSDQGVCNDAARIYLLGAVSKALSGQQDPGPVAMLNTAYLQPPGSHSQSHATVK
jgi:hypothetical protein